MIIPKKNEEFIKDLIKKGEGENLDFKLTITNPRKLARTLAAFANTSGGIILVGVSDQKRIIGVDIAEEMYMVDMACTSYIWPPMSPTFEVYEIVPTWENLEGSEKSLLLVAVSKAAVSHYVVAPNKSMQLYRRVGDKNDRLPD